MLQRLGLSVEFLGRISVIQRQYFKLCLLLLCHMRYCATVYFIYTAITFDNIVAKQQFQLCCKRHFVSSLLCGFCP